MTTLRLFAIAREHDRKENDASPKSLKLLVDLIAVNAANKMETGALS
jgi:hypothetical protein